MVAVELMAAKEDQHFFAAMLSKILRDLRGSELLEDWAGEIAGGQRSARMCAPDLVACRKKLRQFFWSPESGWK